MKQRAERRQFWTGLVERFEGSGKSRRQFAGEAGVGLAIFQYWLYKLRREREVAKVKSKVPIPDVRLVRVTVRPSPAVATHVEVKVAGMRVRVPMGADPAYVARLAVALREARTC
jgi:hypothetical protein